MEAQEVHLWRGNPNGGAVDDESEALVDVDGGRGGDHDLRRPTPRLVIRIQNSDDQNSEWWQRS